MMNSTLLPAWGSHSHNKIFNWNGVWYGVPDSVEVVPNSVNDGLVLLGKYPGSESFHGLRVCRPQPTVTDTQTLVISKPFYEYTTVIYPSVGVERLICQVNESFVTEIDLMRLNYLTIARDLVRNLRPLPANHIVSIWHRPSDPVANDARSRIEIQLDYDDVVFKLIIGAPHWTGVGAEDPPELFAMSVGSEQVFKHLIDNIHNFTDGLVVNGSTYQDHEHIVKSWFCSEEQQQISYRYEARGLFDWAATSISLIATKS